jgi:two-component system, NarL family, nitrate/nitrite response regulator NarL
MTSLTRVLIVTEHASVRAELRTIFQLTDGIAVVGEAANLSDAISQAQAIRPDLALVDLEMRGRQGFEILSQLKSQHLAKALAALTAHDYPAACESAVRCGADAIIIKGAHLAVMLEIIRNTMQRSDQEII